MTRLTETLASKLAEKGLTQAELARRLDVNQQTINGFFNGKVGKTHLWREIAHELEIPEDEMRALMLEAGRQVGKNTKLPRTYKATEFFPDLQGVDVAPPAGGPKLGKFIPVLGLAVGGSDGEYVFNGSPLDYVPNIASLCNVIDAYAIYIDGESMVPRYRPGEIAYVHPAKPPRRGDDVVVQIRPRNEGEPPHGFVKQFVAWTDSKLILHQFNPAGDIEFDKNMVVSVHTIMQSGKH